MITTNLTGNFGNHMWQYTVCRVIAENLGYEWGVDSSPTHDYHNGNNQMDFMDVDFGKPIQGITQDYHEPWKHYQHVDNVNITMFNASLYEIDDNTRLIGDNGAKGGIYQSEDYIIDRKEDIKQWFNINDGKRLEFEETLTNLGITLDDDLCVINFRGGEYRGIPNVIVRKEYWRDSINHMLELNPNMKFLLITDDVQCAKSYMPFDIPAYHISIGFDYYAVNQAKWLIISNSTFGWWPAWLNVNVNKIIAPKYWARHNVSDGYWSIGDSYTRGFDYMDREGNLSNYETCRKDAEEYYKNKGIL
jgi:hypothetical protein